MTRKATTPSRLQKDNIGKQINGWNVGFGDLAFYHRNWLLRVAGALAGTYGNSAEEARYPATTTNRSGQFLNGSKHNSGQEQPQSTILAGNLRNWPSAAAYKTPLGENPRWDTRTSAAWAEGRTASSRPVHVRIASSPILWLEAQLTARRDYRRQQHGTHQESFSEVF